MELKDLLTLFAVGVFLISWCWWLDIRQTRREQRERLERRIDQIFAEKDNATNQL